MDTNRCVANERKRVAQHHWTKNTGELERKTELPSYRTKELATERANGVTSGSKEWRNASTS